MKKFTSHDRQYCIDEYGIHQIDVKPYIYDLKYCSIYDTPEYQKQSDLLQGLRLGFVIGSHGKIPNNILDYGCGNGAFIKFASKIVPQTYGWDISNVEIDNCIIVNNPYKDKYDVITFWDCLEHIEDLSFIQKLSCETIVISLPYCHFSVLGKEWFDEQYKHRKPDEHVHHFDSIQLINLMGRYGWSVISQSTHEDIVRVSNNNITNILSMSFKKMY